MLLFTNRTHVCERIAMISLGISQERVTKQEMRHHHHYQHPHHNRVKPNIIRICVLLCARIMHRRV